VIAHIAGVPAEETLLLVSGLGTGLVLAHAWVASRLRCRVPRTVRSGKTA
jgi:hypothetical protein